MVSNNCDGKQPITILKCLRYIPLFLLLLNLELNAQGAENSFRIVEPKNEEVFSPGETIQVIVQPSPGASFLQARVIGEQPLGISEIKSSPPFEFSLPIPLNTRPGRYRITVNGICSPQLIQESDYITILIERADSPSKIKVEPNQIQFPYTGSQMPLRVIGFFNSDEMISITKSSRTIYRSTDNGVARIESWGVVTAVGSGSATILANYEDQSAKVVVTVPVTIRGDLDGDGDVDKDDLNIIMDASNRPSNGPFDARDLNGDGIINELDGKVLKELCTRENCSTVGMIKDGKRIATYLEGIQTPTLPSAGLSNVALVDPIPALLDGSQITTDINILASQGKNVQGVAADGVSQVLLRIPANRVGEQFDLSVLKEDTTPSNSANEDGILGNPGSPNFQTSTTVTAVNTSGGILGFAIYRAPLDFPRQNGIDVNNGTRTIFVQVKSRDVGSFSANVAISIIRPPVILIHGLWGDSTSFDSFTPLIFDSKYFLRPVDYSAPPNNQLLSIISSFPGYSSDILTLAKGNALGLSYNSPLVLSQIEGFIKEFKITKGVASIQADIIAHSMGGDIARTLPLLASYLSMDTFAQGVIHKLITIGTPHLGTPLATLLLQDNNKCTRDMLASHGLVSFGSVALVGGFYFNGAVGDLQGDLAGGNLSSALRDIQQYGQNLPMALIGGSMSQDQLDGLHCLTCGAEGIWFSCGTDILGGNLTPEGWPKVVGNESDAIVPLNSQVNGQNPHASLVSVHAAVHSSAVADKDGFGSLGFGGPHELEAASGIPNRVIDFLNTPLTGGIQTPSYAYWVLPSTARASGLGGSFYTTDLTITNTGLSDATVTMKFLGNNVDGRSGAEKTIHLAATKSITFKDVLNSVFGLTSGYGAIRIISSTQFLEVQGQTSTPGAGGTFGQSVPAAASHELVRPSRSMSILGVREDASFRTNLILTNAGESPLDADVSLISDDGLTLGSKRYNLLPLGMTQITKVVRDLGITSDLKEARIHLSTQTANGAFAAYASVIDNVTNDPRTLLPKFVTLGAPTWFLPSSARAPGAGGAFYTTDLTISNTGTNDASFTMKFLGNNIDGRQGVEKSFLLGAGKTVTYWDVLGSVFGLSTGWGAIRVTSSSNAMTVMGQTSTPGAGGTFGQSVPAAYTLDYIIPELPRSIIAIREDSSFRTNLILANATESTVDVHISLIGEDGGVLGSKHYTLPPLGMTQVSRVVRDLGVAGDISGAQILLSTPTPNGAFTAYASVIDNVTNDPRTLLPLFGSSLTDGTSTPITWGNNVNLTINNSLIYPVNLFANGANIGTAPASQTWTSQVVAPAKLQLSFDLIRPSPFGVPLGETMKLFYPSINNPTGNLVYNVTNIIGSQPYFVPMVTNQTSVGLLMGVNMGLQAENRCNCVVPANKTNVNFGYYRLFSNGNVRAYRDGSNYTGSYRYWQYGTHYDYTNVESQTGILRLLDTIPP